MQQQEIDCIELLSLRHTPVPERADNYSAESESNSCAVNDPEMLPGESWPVIDVEIEHRTDSRKRHERS